MRNTGLALKLVLLIVPVTLVVFLLILGYYYHISKEIIINNVEDNSKNIALSAVSKIENYLRTFELAPENLTYIIENTNYSQEDILEYIRLIVKNNGEIFGSAIAYEPFRYHPDKKYFAPYYYKNNKRIEFKYLGSDSYRYFDMDWYKKPASTLKSQWSEPYFDEGGGNILMSTFSVPFYSTESGRREFTGVITADISLSWLSNIVSSLDISRRGYGFLISRSGTFLAHPYKSMIMNESIFSVAEARNSSQISVLGEKMISGKSGFELTQDFVSPERYWIYYAPMARSGWSLGIMFPENEIMSDINELGKNAVLISLEGILILILVIIYISRTITKPLRSLADATKDIASGNLEFDVPEIASRDEVGNLSRSFEYMKGSLKQYISDLKDTTAIKERIESELKIARDIQMGILPKKFPPFPDRTEFDIYAAIKPAREVGGDFYDFFFLDKNRLFFLIGDVSDKGVPASLFMAVTKTLIKAVALLNNPLNEIVYNVNNDLCVDNDMSLFVTVFCGILDTTNGEIIYTNGGHNCPLYINRNGRVAELERTKGTAMGVFTNIEYGICKVVLKEGESLFLYTDGVTEAADNNGNLYGINSLIENLEKCYNLNAKEITEYIERDIGEYSKNALQADDVTMLALKYNGKSEPELEIEVDNEIDDLNYLNKAVTDYLDKTGTSKDVLGDIQLALEEIITNIIKYAYKDEGQHKIKIIISNKSDSISIEIIDDGIEFNPFNYPEPDISTPMEEREIGGLGIHLVRNIMDDLKYKRDKGQNRVLMVKYI